MLLTATTPKNRANRCRTLAGCVCARLRTTPNRAMAIVAVLVGGTPLTGGVGGVLNTAIGTLIVMVIRAAMVYLEVDATQQQMIFGIVLIVAIALTIDRSKMRIVK